MNLSGIAGNPAWKKRGLVAAGAIALYAVFGFFILPGIVRSQAVKAIRENLGREATIAEVKFNPFLLALTVNGFDLKDPDGQTFVSFGQFHADFQLSSLFRRAWTFSEIRLASPFFRVVMTGEGQYNFSDILGRADKKAGPAPAEPKSGALPGVLIGLLELRDGRALFRDTSGGRDAKAEFGPVEFTVREFSTRPREDSQYSFAAETTRGEKIEWEGTFFLDPLSSSGRFSLSGIQLRPFWEYVQDRVRFELRAGTVSVVSNYSWDRTSDLRLSGATVTLDGLAITDKGQDPVLVSVPSFAIRDVGADLKARTVKIPVIESKAARFVVVREPDGTINLQSLFAPPPPAAPAAVPGTSAPSPETAPVQSGAARPAPPETAPAKAAPEWKATVEKLLFEDWGLEFEDRTPPSPAKIPVVPVRLELTDIVYPFEKEMGVALSLGVGDSGKFDLKGKAGLKPLSAEFDYTLEALPLTLFQPYVEQQANAELKAGLFGSSGHVAFSQPEGQPAAVKFAGAAKVSSLRAVDQRVGDDFVRWDGISLNGIEASVSPLNLKIDEILIEKLYSRVIVRKDQSTNLIDIMKGPAAPAKPSAPKPDAPAELAAGEPAKDSRKEPPPPYRAEIRSVRFVNSSADFSDYSIEPGFTTGIFGLKGTISGLSSHRKGYAKVKMEGKVDRYAPVYITGDLNPLTSRAYTDVTLSFQGIEVSNFTPYSAKFAGYTIDKGKMYLDLNYKLNNRKLVGENKVMLDQFTFGKKVNSPDATGLPVKLAVAILTDRDGKIKIDLPVRGDLDDPDFKYGPIIWQALKNVLEKVAAAPFTALASLVVGADGDQLSHIDFEPGHAEMAGTEHSKFPVIGKLLADRPVLRVEIQGTADGDRDAVSLQEAALEVQMRAMRAEEMKGWGGKAPDPATLVLSDADTGRILRRIYQQTFSETPAQVYARLKAEATGGEFPAENSIEAQEAVTEAVRDRLVRMQPVDAVALRGLARKRAEAVQAGLVELGGIEPARLFIRDVEILDSSAPGAEVSALGPVKTNLLLTAD